MAKPKKTSVSVDPELWDLFGKEAQYERQPRQSIQSALDEALRLWLYGDKNGGKKEPELPPEIENVLRLFTTPEDQLGELEKKFKAYTEAFLRFAEEMRKK